MEYTFEITPKSKKASVKKLVATVQAKTPEEAETNLRVALLSGSRFNFNQVDVVK